MKSRIAQPTISDHLDAIERRNQLLLDNQGLIHSVIHRNFSRLASLVGYDEVFQTACLAAIREIGGWNPDRGAFSTYLTLVVKSRLLDWQAREYRDRNRFVLAAEPLDGPESAHKPSRNLEDFVDGRLDADVVLSYVNDLRAGDMRRCLSLYYGLNGCEPILRKEIAAEMGLSLSHVKYLLDAGRDAIRMRIGLEVAA